MRDSRAFLSFPLHASYLQHFAAAGKPEAAVMAYKQAGLFDDAIRCAQRHAPHMLGELQAEQAQYMATAAPSQPEAAIQQAKKLVQTGRAHEAIDALLRITRDHSDQVDALQRVWEQAVHVALEHLPARAVEVVQVVARRLAECALHDAAAQAWLAVDEVRGAVDAYCAGGNFAKARTLAQTSAPHLLDQVERAAQVHRRTVCT